MTAYAALVFRRAVIISCLVHSDVRRDFRTGRQQGDPGRRLDRDLR